MRGAIKGPTYQCTETAPRRTKKILPTVQGLIDLPLDVLKHTLSFCSPRDVSLTSAVSKEFHYIYRLWQLDFVSHIASYVSADEEYHIRRVTSSQKAAMDVNLVDMTTTTAVGVSYLIMAPIARFGEKWAKFVECSLRRIPKQDCNGYWQIMEDDLECHQSWDTHPEVSIAELNILRSLVLHPVIAPMLINYDDPIPFQRTINVNIHGVDELLDRADRRYQMSYWNGGDVDQCTAFQIASNLTDDGQVRNQSFLHCQTAPADCSWQWFDNDSAKYRAYAMGSAVEAQLEVSLQANVHFTPSVGHFANVNFNAFKAAIIPRLTATEAAHKRRRHFLLRFKFTRPTFDDDPNSDSKKDEDHHAARRRIESVEQVAVHPRPFCTFPRTVRRLRKSADVVDFEPQRWRLRMDPSQ